MTEDSALFWLNNNLKSNGMKKMLKSNITYKLEVTLTFANTRLMALFASPFCAAEERFFPCDAPINISTASRRRWLKSPGKSSSGNRLAT